ncbi:hypothetical protein GCK72_015860 [Caenorhabditis remanei]|uniref:Uncharacterized protein n=1 Tax=Caenorhabditis remanei TaxID=31234 RepID=A0A6A5GYC9_CAERE|nr:hypothetical protein GCK72_015860 [Caenorhabditis remanei]KAF1759393.1 hypothetical protein GCK72_015860 [Caenorhabditis remanei]
MNAQQQLIQHLEQQIVELHQKLEKEKDDHEQTKSQISFEQSLVRRLSSLVPNLEATISNLTNENNELKQKLQKEAVSQKKLDAKAIRRNEMILRLLNEKKASEKKGQELSKLLQELGAEFHQVKKEIAIVDAELHQAKKEIELLQKTIARRDARIRTTKEVVSGVIAKQEADTDSQTLSMVMKLSEAEHTAVVKDTEVKILKDMMATIIW